MNDKRYTYVLYAITLVIVATIGIQGFWNYKNYQANKEQLIRDIQISLDKAVDDYYASLAKETPISFTLSDSTDNDFHFENKNTPTFINNVRTLNDELDSLKIDNIKSLKILKGFESDSLYRALTTDSLNRENFKLFTTKVFISLQNDSLDVRKVNKLLYDDLRRKNLNLDHQLAYFCNVPKEGLFNENFKHHKKLYNTQTEDYNIYIESKSTLLPKNSLLRLGFSNETLTILKRSLSGILISTFLILAVISCLFYLLKVIKHQKQLSEVKNDLISNITHEFKTPIATIGVALESISNFNAIDDKAKTQKYIGMSSEQLSKLNTMVEKLLETATLDSDNLKLNKEAANVVELLTSLSNRYKLHFTEKDFNTSFKVEQLMANVDLFHFENALNNILDNAVKYGGNIISIDLVPRDNYFEIHISDNGNNLSKTNKDKIFEKFYRIPKGNTHDVKGFGIGLYYTKTIVEKHGGHIAIDLSNQLTTFKISLPNG